MTAHIAHMANVSRPKVHRLPRRAHETRRLQLMAAILSYGNAAKFIFTLSSLVLALVLSVLFLGRPLALMTSDSAKKPVTIADSGLFSSADAVASAISTASPAKTIILKGDQGMIIGQMARLSAPALSSGDISAVSEVDNHREQELLSILNRN